MHVQSHCFLRSMNVMQVLGENWTKKVDDLPPFEILRNPKFAHKD